MKCLCQVEGERPALFLLALVYCMLEEGLLMVSQMQDLAVIT